MSPRYIIDIEANGLQPTEVFCICVKNMETGQCLEWVPETLHLFKDWLYEDTKLIGHNIIKYDGPVLNRLLGTNIKLKDMEDTLVLSYLFNPLRGRHSLEFLGKQIGCEVDKVAHEDWTQFSQDMLVRCRSDVEINHQVYKFLKAEGLEFSEESMRLEHKVTHILHKMQQHGFYLDERKAHELYVECKTKADTIEQEILRNFGKLTKFKKEVTPKHNKKDGAISSVGLKRLYPAYEDLVGGEFSEVSFEDFKLSSTKQVVRVLDRVGWKPTVRTKTGASWQVCEENLKTISNTAPPELRKLPEWLMLTSRYKTIGAWLDELQYDGYVRGSVISPGSITTRCAHRNPNMANIPSVDAPYGRACRACWTVHDPTSSCIVGCDASGIQLRVLAHYMGDRDYIEAVCYGDVHTFNKEALGIDSRDASKTFIYAWLLGAGDAKIGSIIGGSAKDGRDMKAKFLDRIPSLKRLKQRAKVAAQRGYLKGLDGRHIVIKSEHYALSAYLQGGEACIMKKAMCFGYDRTRRAKVPMDYLAFVHDEFQVETLRTTADTVGDILVNSIIDAGRYFKLKCPLDAEYKIGDNWAETH